MKNNLNRFEGENALLDYLNPGKSLPLPIVELPPKLNPFYDKGVRIHVKMMSHLPLLNIKSIPAYNMLLEAHARGDLKDATAIIENSSGNTVSSLAVIGKLLGIDSTRAYVSNQVTPGKLDLLRFSGIVPVVNMEPICPDPADPNSGIYKAKQEAKKNNWYNPGQYDNTDNPDAHYKWTGPQIYQQLEEDVQVIAVSLGTTGTTYAAKYLKEQNANILSIGMVRALHNPIPGPRTKSLLREIAFDWKSNIDAEEEVLTVEAYEESLELSRYGLMVGPSSGMILAGLKKHLNKLVKNNNLEALRNKHGEINAVIVACDTPLPYLKEYFKYCSPDSFPSIENEELLDIKSDSSEKINNIETVNIGKRVSDAYGEIYAAPIDTLWNNLQEGTPIHLRENVRVIDLRINALYEHAHLPNSELFTGSTEQELKEISKQLNLNPSTKYYIICTYGDKSDVLARLITEQGYTAFSLVGGFKEWLRLELPVVRKSFCNVGNNGKYHQLIN